MADVGQQYSKKFRLFHLLSNILRLLYHQASYAVTHGGFLFHLIAATNGVLIVDDELPAVSPPPLCRWVLTPGSVCFDLAASFLVICYLVFPVTIIVIAYIVFCVILLQ